MLFRKELILEWRNRVALNGILLYVVSSIFIVYMSFRVKTSSLDPITWNALFWIILLFASINGIAKSFILERKERLNYFYLLARPEAIILSKALYNIFLSLSMALLAYLAYSLFLSNPVEDHFIFLLNILLGTIGFSLILTMVSGIAAKADNSNTLMAVLGFPILLPVLLLCIKISQSAIDGLDRSLLYDEILSLIGLNLIVLSLSYILFPYLWRS